MSFITRCPACGTAFKVVSDQLKISEGWVRCGHCAQVFDATLDLQPWWPGAEPGGATVPAEEAPSSPDAGEPATQEEPLPQDLPPEETTDDEGVQAAGGVAEPRELDQPEEFAEVPVEAAEEPPVEIPFEPAPDPGDADLNVFMASPAPVVEIAPEVQEENEAAILADEDQPKPSFVRQAERRAFWRRPAVRAAGWLGALLLTLVLAGQAAYLWRDQLAAQSPKAAAWMERFCAQAGCHISPLRAIDQVSIDSSALLRLATGRYAFDMVVKNAGTAAVAAPSLELTLTDVDGRVLVRRVLMASDWPQALHTLPPASDRAVRLELALDGPEAAVMTGYRALLFYP